jgi:hypothetical protein
MHCTPLQVMLELNAWVGFISLIGRMELPLVPVVWQGDIGEYLAKHQSMSHSCGSPQTGWCERTRVKT